MPLTVSEVEPGHHRVEVLVRFSDAETLFLLDTGAPKTTLTANERTGRYAAIRSSESKGVAGVGSACDGTPAILGTNVIEPAAWTFDLRTNRWAVEPHADHAR